MVEEAEDLPVHPDQRHAKCVWGMYYDYGGKEGSLGSFESHPGGGHRAQLRNCVMSATDGWFGSG